jgi:hypothetical protein
MPEGRLADQPLAAAATPVGADHLGRGPGLVDEDQAGCIKECLTSLPEVPGLGHVGPFLLGGMQSFLKLTPCRLKKRSTELSVVRTPRFCQSRCTISAKVRSGCWATNSSSHATCGSSGERLLRSGRRGPDRG